MPNGNYYQANKEKLKEQAKITMGFFNNIIDLFLSIFELV